MSQTSAMVCPVALLCSLQPSVLPPGSAFTAWGFPWGLDTTEGLCPMCPQALGAPRGTAWWQGTMGTLCDHPGASRCDSPTSSQPCLSASPLRQAAPTSAPPHPMSVGPLCLSQPRISWPR